MQMASRKYEESAESGVISRWGNGWYAETSRQVAGFEPAPPGLPGSAQAEFSQHVTLFDCAARFPQTLRLFGHSDVGIVLRPRFDPTGAHPCCMSRRDDGAVMVRGHC